MDRQDTGVRATGARLRGAISVTLTLIAVLAATGVADAGKGKKKNVAHKGKVGISATVDPGDPWVPASGGDIKLKFAAKGKRIKQLKRVAFDEIFYTCDGGPGYLVNDARFGPAKVKKGSKKRPPRFRYTESGDAFGAIGVSSAKNFKFEFKGSILKRGKRATGVLRSSFKDRSQGACTTYTQVWRSEKR